MDKAKKSEWIIKKEKKRKKQFEDTFWLYGLHAVKDALMNINRTKKELILTPNAHDKLSKFLDLASFDPTVIEPRKFLPPIDKNSVHQGVALQVNPLNWGSSSEICAPNKENSLLLLLDRVTDPQNVGAILRSAEVFQAKAVIAPYRHSAPETGALAKSASGSLERQAYLRVPNLARAMLNLKEMGYYIIGLDSQGDQTINEVLLTISPRPVAIVAGAEGAGLRELTKKTCNTLAKIHDHTQFSSLNVSNATAIALFSTRQKLNFWSK